MGLLQELQEKYKNQNLQHYKFTVGKERKELKTTLKTEAEVAPLIVS